MEAQGPLWPAPKPLEGVKSRRRPFFEAYVGSHPHAGVSLTLRSRVAALGEVADVAKGLLLGTTCTLHDLAEWDVRRHECLVVVHLGPHLIAREGHSGGTYPTEEQGCAEILKGPHDGRRHEVAIATALATRPQVVILDEGRDFGDPSWATAFHDLLHGEAFRTFRGAVIVCANADSPSIIRACSEQWVTMQGHLQQRIIDNSVLEIIEDIALDDHEVECGAKAHVDGSLIEEVRALSVACFGSRITLFGEDCPLSEAYDNAWTMTLLTESGPLVDKSLSGRSHARLRGYICYELIPQPRSEFHIHRLAVPSQYRGMGHGRHLMRWALTKAAQLPQSEYAWVSCCALNSSIGFYGQFGFMVPEGADDSDGTTKMLLRNRGTGSTMSACANYFEDAFSDDSETVKGAGLGDWTERERNAVALQ